MSGVASGAATGAAATGVAAAAFPAAGAAGSLESSAPTAAIEALEAARCAWLVSPRAEDFDALFDPGLRFEHSTGRVDSAESFKEFVLSGAVDYRAVRHELLCLGGDPETGAVRAEGVLSTELFKAGELKRLRSTTEAEFALGPDGWRLRSLTCTAVPAEPARPARSATEPDTAAHAAPAAANPAPAEPGDARRPPPSGRRSPMARTGKRALDALRELILGGHFHPGARLQPGQISELLETSTTVVRESLTKLVAEGLVTQRPQRGFTVRELNARELEDVTELRCAVEVLGARLAIERGDLAWEAGLIAAHHRLARTARRREDGELSSEWEDAHRAFHRVLIDGAECRPVSEHSEALARTTQLYLRWAAASPAAGVRDVEAEHKELLDAALARDAGRLAEALHAHFHRTAEVVLRAGIVAAPESAVSSARPRA